MTALDLLTTHWALIGLGLICLLAAFLAGFGAGRAWVDAGADQPGAAAVIAGHACAGCAYFAPSPDNASFGQCRIAAPLVMVTAESRPRTVWPIVQAIWCCGEHAQPESVAE